MILGLGRFGGAIFDLMNRNEIKSAGFDNTDLVKKFIKKKGGAFADAEDPGFWSKLRFIKLRVIILALPNEAQKDQLYKQRNMALMEKSLGHQGLKRIRMSLKYWAPILFLMRMSSGGISDSLVKNIDNS